MVPDGAEVLDNPNGTAPGLWIEDGRRIVLLLPGPPRELKPMLRAVVNRLAGRCGSTTLLRRVIRVTGRTESHADEAMQPLYAEWSRAPVPIAATILAALGQIELHLSACTDSRERVERPAPAA
jgi:nicotinamide-nucleotide amidase